MLWELARFVTIYNAQASWYSLLPSCYIIVALCFFFSMNIEYPSCARQPRYTIDGDEFRDEMKRNIG